MPPARAPKQRARRFRIDDLGQPPALKPLKPTTNMSKTLVDHVHGRLPLFLFLGKRRRNDGRGHVADQALSFRLRSSPFSNELARSAKKSYTRERHVHMLSKGPTYSKQYYSGPSLEPTAWDYFPSHRWVKHLGTGGEGSAHLLEREYDKQVVCCKVIPRHSRHAPVIAKELTIVKDLLGHHDRIIQIHAAIASPRQTEIYMDYCDGGDLHQLISNYYFNPCHTPASIPESFIWHAFGQLAEALLYIHHGVSPSDLPKQRHHLPPSGDGVYNSSSSSSSSSSIFRADWLSVIHRDIKPANILLRHAPYSASHHPGPQPYPRLVLSDFGLALPAASPHALPNSVCSIGTPEWQPPELPVHSTKSDVWAVGAVVWALCSGGPPIKPMPEGFGRENWEVWVEMGEARMMDREVVSFGYGRALDQV
ncbi:MAG: hypothetical protein Q9214_004706, partial [Letrouitia sp. 1 TL-2023]